MRRARSFPFRASVPRAILDAADGIPADCAEYRDAVAALPRWELDTDLPTTSDSPLFKGTGALRLGLAF